MLPGSHEPGEKALAPKMWVRKGLKVGVQPQMRPVLISSTLVIEFSDYASGKKWTVVVIGRDGRLTSRAMFGRHAMGNRKRKGLAA